jgi:hypothetical protein
MAPAADAPGPIRHRDSHRGRAQNRSVIRAIPTIDVIDESGARRCELPLVDRQRIGDPLSQ